jgi:thiol-disulfide isomerase/thioredoxin
MLKSRVILIGFFIKKSCKTLNLALVFLILAITSFGQSIIQGNLPSFPSTNFKIASDKSVLNNYAEEKLAEGKTNGKGEFAATFKLSYEGPLIISIDRLFFRVWMIPDTNLSIKEIALDSYSFSGASEKENTFLYQTNIMMPFKQSGSVGDKVFEPKKQDIFLNEIESKRSAVFDSIFATNKASKVFDDYVKAEILNFTLLNKNQYAKRSLVVKTVKPQDIPNDYYNFWSKFKLFDDNCLSGSYQDSLRDFIDYQALKKLNNDNSDAEKLFQAQFEIMDSLLLNRPITMQKQKTWTLLFLIKYFDFPILVQNEVEKYSKQFPASPSVELIRKEIEKKNKNTLTTPSFKLKDVAGKFVDINDLRGKVVYIDFWGSWCKACLLQMPNSAILQKKFKNKDVVFLFIDFYDTKEKWLEAIKVKKLSGLHLKAEDSDEEYFDNIFGVKQGFPRYALIDKSGRLVTTSAPHPNNPQLIGLIETYLNQK